MQIQQQTELLNRLVETLRKSTIVGRFAMAEAIVGAKNELFAWRRGDKHAARAMAAGRPASAAYVYWVVYQEYRAGAPSVVWNTCRRTRPTPIETWVDLESLTEEIRQDAGCHRVVVTDYRLLAG